MHVGKLFLDVMIHLTMLVTMNNKYTMRSLMIVGDYFDVFFRGAG